MFLMKGDPSTLGDGELAARIEVLAAELATAQGRLLDAIGEADRRGLWRHDGATSCASWLAARLGVSHRTARSWTETARGLARLPETRAAFEEGALCLDQVRVLIRSTDPDQELDDVAAAKASTYDQLRRAVRAREEVDLDGIRTAHRWRRVRWDFDESRRKFTLVAELPDDQGAVVMSALERIADTTPPDPDLGLHLGYGARLADALLAMASHSLGADRDPDRATVVVHVDAAVFAGSRPGSGVVTGGPALHPETVRRLACDARWQVVAEAAGRTVGIGRTSRTIPPWLVRQLAHRDGGCRFPGCGRRRWVHAHHIVHWSRGGPTDLDNLITLCAFHHRLLHEGGWRLSGDPNGSVTWIRPNGDPYEPRPTERSLIRWANYELDRVRGSAVTDTS